MKKKVLCLVSKKQIHNYITKIVLIKGGTIFCKLKLDIRK